MPRGGGDERVRLSHFVVHCIRVRIFLPTIPFVFFHNNNKVNTTFCKSNHTKDVQGIKIKQLDIESTLPLNFMAPKRVWKPVIVWKEDVSHKAKKGERDDKKEEDKKQHLFGFIL